MDTLYTNIMVKKGYREIYYTRVQAVITTTFYFILDKIVSKVQVDVNSSGV